MTNLEKFVAGYLACVAWDSEEKAEFDDAAREVALLDCRLFMTACGDDLMQQAADIVGWESLGHDFWLTRMNAGTGYWDRNELAVPACARVYGLRRFIGTAYAPDGDSLGDALTSIAAGTDQAISRFAHVSLYVEDGLFVFV